MSSKVGAHKVAKYTIPFLLALLIALWIEDYWITWTVFEKALALIVVALAGVILFKKRIKTEIG